MYDQEHQHETPGINREDHRLFLYRLHTLGYGFLESVYQSAMVIELCKKGLIVQPHFPINVFYHNQIVGEFFADLLVEECVIVKLKAVHELAIDHEAQLLNYLNATEYEVGLLLNFGSAPQIKRKVFDNERKKYKHHTSEN